MFGGGAARNEISEPWQEISHHVFAGVGVGPSESVTNTSSSSSCPSSRRAVVDRVGGLLRQVFAPEQAVGDSESLRAREADDGNGAQAGGRGKGNDGISEW
jgi:hypothetical protein